MYTHYYSRKRKLNEKEYQALLLFSDKLREEIEANFPEIDLEFERNSISVSPKNNGDTFSVPKNLSKKFEEDDYGMISLWCNTSKQPYDIVVVALLEAMKYYDIIRSYITDGDLVNTEEGRRLFLTILENNQELRDDEPKKNKDSKKKN